MQVLFSFENCAEMFSLGAADFDSINFGSQFEVS